MVGKSRSGLCRSRRALVTCIFKIDLRWFFDISWLWLSLDYYDEPSPFKEESRALRQSKRPGEIHSSPLSFHVNLRTQKFSIPAVSGTDLASYSTVRGLYKGEEP